ncbi:MAG: glycine cleavage system protein GcvH [Desulfurococcaceae archaeon]
MSELVIKVKGKEYVIKTDRRYTETDEWAKLENDRIVCGISDYAQKELKDIVAVELPQVGRVVRKGEELGMIDSVKATSPYYAPVSGKIVEVNRNLETSPELINKDPYGEGWIFVILPDDPREYTSLLPPEKYAEKIQQGKK